MLRDEAYHFIRLGTHLERADNTARILDIKYHIAAAVARPTSAAPSTTTSGRRCCARCRASRRTARSTATSSRRGASPSS